MSKRYQSWDKQIVPLIDGIQARGCVTFYELMKIGAWKAVLPLPYLTLNTPEQVEMITKEAIKRAREEDVSGAIEVLGKLEGMKTSLKTRSAVLAVAFYPDFPVIDKYAYQVTRVLFYDCYVSDVPDCEPGTFVEYFRCVKSKAEEWGGITIKEADERLMKVGMDAEKLVKESPDMDNKEAIKIAYARRMEMGAQRESDENTAGQP